MSEDHPDYEKPRGCLDGGTIPPEKLLALQRGRGYDEVRKLAWAAISAWQHPSRATLHDVNIYLEALASLLRDIAPWEEPHV